MGVKLDMKAIRTISGMSGVPQQQLVGALKKFYKTTENLFANSEQACKRWFRLTSRDDSDEEGCLEEVTVYSCFNRLCIKEMETATLDQVRKKETIPGSPAQMAVIKRLDFLTRQGHDEPTRPKVKQATEENETYVCTGDAYKACRSFPVGSPEYDEAMAYYCRLFIEDLKKVESATEVQNMAYHAIRGSLAEKTAKNLAKWLFSLEKLKNNPQSVCNIVSVYETLAGYN